MENLHYTYYDIDAADIWEYECSCYVEGKGDKSRMKELYTYLQNFYLLAKHKPFIEDGDESAYAEEYRERYRTRNEDEVTWNFFVWDRKVYAMNRPCIVSLENHNRLAFQRLFILKLLQYWDGLLYVEHFLKHQLRVNFKNKLDNFQKFVKVSLLQHPGVIDTILVGMIEEWFLEMGKRKSEKASRPKSKRSKRENFDQDVKTDTVATGENQRDVNPENKYEEPEREKQEVEKTSSGKDENNFTDALHVELETEETIPNDYKVVEGKFTKEEVQHFFSFLYKEKSKEGKAFLLENEVIEIFKYGLAIPMEPPATKYKLKCSLTFPKSIVEYGIYTFYREHTSSHRKQEILKFFASYIEDFANALKDDKAMQTWSDNVVGKRPARSKFAIGEYLPERFR